MIDTNQLVEIRWHGRGGQGAVTSAELLARAAINEGKYAQAFPSFGPERRGAPVVAFDRINAKEPIRTRADVTEPDVVIVLDPRLLDVVNVTAGLKKTGILIINSKKTMAELKSKLGTKWRLAVVDGTKIAQELLGVPIVNTTMLGAMVKAAGLVKMDSLVEPIEHRFERLAERNINAMKRAFEETIVEE
ncbi:MAG: 2-oxoacid:acceptor oxidoreductase family protein [Dehalococcoidales bacterium]|nr:2-oxoacid:acceptor oxidoreductase family protein [Dehalococcoidales bacterium]